MTINIRSLTKQTVTYGVGTILTRFVTFLLLPVYTNVLSKSDYGLAVLVFVFLGFMNHIYSYGLDSAFMRHYSAETDKSKMCKIFSTAIWMALLSSIALSTVVLLLQTPISKLLLSGKQDAIYIRYAAIILFFDCICRVPFALFRQEEKPFHFVGVRFINVLLTLGLNIYFVVILKNGIIGIFKSNLITSSVTAAIIYFLMIKNVSFTFSSSTAKNLFFFGLPFVPIGLATAAIELINRHILERFIGLAAVGVFSAGFKLGIFMLLITTAFYYAWQPFFLKAGKQESSRRLFARVLTYFVLTELTLWVILTAFIRDIVSFNIRGVYLIGPEFHDCVSIVPIILISYIFLGINQVFLPGIYFEKKTRYLAYITVFAALANVIANLILIPRFGIVGSAYATLIGYIALASMTYCASQKFFRVPYEFGRIAFLFFLAVTAGAFIFLSDPDVIVKIAVIILLPSLLKIMGFFKKEELESLKAFFHLKNKHE